MFAINLAIPVTTAVDDAYAVVEPQSGFVRLQVPAPGVLANDIGPSPLTAVLESGVQHGSLAFQSDGSFNYIPTLGFTGADSFRYRATSDAATSPAATVRITVVGFNNSGTTCTIDPQSVVNYTLGSDSFSFDVKVRVQQGGIPLAGAEVALAADVPLVGTDTAATTDFRGEAQFRVVVDHYRGAVTASTSPPSTCIEAVDIEPSPFSAILSACPLLFGSLARNQDSGDSLDLFRRFRDRVLARSGPGKDYAKQYYRFRPELGRIILTNPRLLLRIREKLKRYLPLVEALVGGRGGTLSRADLNEIEELVKSLEAQASPEFRRVLAQLRRDFFDPMLLASHGVTIREEPGTVSAAGSVREAYGKLPLRFEINHGQAERSVNFVARGPGYNIYLKPAETVLALGDGAPRVRMKIAGGLASPRVSPEAPLPGATNYLLGAGPKTWRTGVRSYARVRYEQVYPGIDVVYYGNQRQLEYDFVVAPAASPSRIALEFRGVERVETGANGDLLLHQSSRDLRLRKPVVYQEIEGERRLIAGGYVIRGRDRVGFRVGSYDTARPLVIDPVLSYSSYLGGSGLEAGMAIAVDANGNAYLTGATTSANFPTLGPLQQRSGGGGQFGADGFVTKLDPTGTQVLYSTYFGGSDDDIGMGIAVDAQGNAYVAGLTRSRDFPTVQPIQRVFGGAGAIFKTDAFVLKLDPTGSKLVYSTYLGGSGDDGARGIAIDAAGNAYVAGGTSSTNFPTVNALQAANAGGGRFGSDAFVAKINAAGTALVYSTYLGGSGDDAAGAIAVDSAGNAYLTGVTYSANFPLSNALQETSGGGSDVFAAKLNAAGSALAYSTYLGGKGDEFGTGIAVDPQGSAYLTGFTGSSSDFPRVNPAQPAFGSPDGSGIDAFVAKLNTAGSALVYSTFLGGKGWDYGYGIALDAQGSAYIAGETDSPDFSTAGSLLAAPGGKTDAFVAKLNAAGSAFEYRNYLGGSNDDGAVAVAVDGNGNVYVAGGSTSVDSPVTFAAYQTALAGLSDAWVVKIGSGTGPALVASVSAASQAGATGLAPDSIASAYGAGLAAGVTITPGQPPLTSLAGVTVSVRDSAGTDRLAPLYFVSPGQINYVIPTATGDGLAAVTVNRDGQVAATGTARIERVAPALFTANNSGRGVPAALALAVAADGSRTTVDVFQCGAAAGTCAPSPIDVSGEGRKVYLLLFGTGIRRFTRSVTASIGGVGIPVLSATPQSEFVGMDQVNVGPLPPSLAGRGQVDLVLTVDDRAANTVTVNIR